MIRELVSAIVRRVTSPHDREERGYPPIGQGNNLAEVQEKPLTIAPTDVRALVPREDKLLVFRALTGIDTAPVLAGAGHSVRTAPNLGIYTRVVRAEQFAANKYKSISLMINVCLGTQIIVAAILTSLGAADGPHSAVTAFGAINTVIAGVLTYVKGSSLPDKLKYHKDEWKRVREYIEQREREFCVTDCQLDVYEEIYIVEEMYKRVKANLETSKNRASGANANTSTNANAAQPANNNAAPVHNIREMGEHNHHIHHGHHEHHGHSGLASPASPPPTHARVSTRPESSVTAVNAPDHARAQPGE
ncbi:hypothetical protein HJFPF1_09155 [Paramyrothecium foliicola]|nr:hypothetical protein HJFPF1_09155 [Paramyrothecium foliicola]